MQRTPALDGLRVALTEQIAKYTHRNGERPRVILAESDAFLLLSADPDSICWPDGSDRWRGIPVKRIASDGSGVYLCGDPVKFCPVEPVERKIIMPEDV